MSEKNGKKSPSDAKPPRILDLVHADSAQQTGGWPFSLVLNDPRDETAVNSALFQAVPSEAQLKAPQELRSERIRSGMSDVLTIRKAWLSCVPLGTLPKLCTTPSGNIWSEFSAGLLRYTARQTAMHERVMTVSVAAIVRTMKNMASRILSVDE